MMIRSESDFIRTANASYDLAGIVTAYLKLFRQYTNNANDLRIPKDDFAVTFTPSKKEGCITVDIWWTSHYSTQCPTYYEPDDEAFSEVWGDDNTSGYTVVHSSDRESMRINIPISHLMRSEEQMKADFIARATKIAADAKEAARVSRINEITSELAKLTDAAPKEI